jgi:glycosyltransferase involved in cell wall biosynthesis
MIRPSDARPRLAVLFNRLGPYHHDRLRVAAQQGEVTAVEFSGVDKVYAWSDVNQPGGYERRTLFPDGHIDSFGTALVRRHMAYVLSQTQPAVVAIPGWASRGALTALTWCRQTNTPAVVMSDSWAAGRPPQRYRQMVKRRIISLFSSGLVAGEPHRSYLQSLGLPSDRIFTGYDAVDNTHFARGAHAARRLQRMLREKLQLPRRYFLVVCRFTVEKNLTRLLAAYAGYRSQADHDPWHLLVVGDGALKPQLVRLTDELALHRWVHFPGFVRHDALPAYYGLADAFILPSVSETWGLVVNEAMAAGLPVLVSKRCGCAEDLVQQGRNGFCFDPLDIRHMRDSMLRVASARCDRRAMARYGRRIVARWSLDAFSQGLWQAAQVAVEKPRQIASPADRLLLAILSRR